MLALAASFEARQPQTSQPSVTTVFCVFAGREEITNTSRLRIAPSGVREGMIAVGPAKRLTVSLSPGIYDVQRSEPGRMPSSASTGRMPASGIKWTERLVVMNYPDEGGRHLEVINFEPGFGALQVRAYGRPVPGTTPMTLTGSWTLKSRATGRGSR